jgi:mRNA-degrading endonuclease toxin of MazEF toxin-antitoxin module
MDMNFNYETEGIRRGGVYWVPDFFKSTEGLIDENISEETTKYHPWLVVSSDKNNIGKSSNETAVILSTNLDTVWVPTHVVLNSHTNLKPSLVKCECIQTISKDLIGTKLCQVRKTDMAVIERAMMEALQLPVSDEE